MAVRTRSDDGNQPLAAGNRLCTDRDGDRRHRDLVGAVDAALGQQVNDDARQRDDDDHGGGKLQQDTEEFHKRLKAKG
jgi:hypothetical protein